MPTLEQEVRTFIDLWNQAIIAKDVAIAEQLREDGYSAVLPNGRVVTKQEEVALIAATTHRIDAVRVKDLAVRGRWNRAGPRRQAVRHDPRQPNRRAVRELGEGQRSHRCEDQGVTHVSAGETQLWDVCRGARSQFADLL